MLFDFWITHLQDREYSINEYHIKKVGAKGGGAEEEADLAHELKVIVVRCHREHQTLLDVQQDLRRNQPSVTPSHITDATIWHDSSHFGCDVPLCRREPLKVLWRPCEWCLLYLWHPTVKAWRLLYLLQSVGKNVWLAREGGEGWEREKEGVGGCGRVGEGG